MHSASGTVYGGPYGARVIVFALSRILQCLGKLDDPLGVPESIKASLRSRGNQWSTSQALHLAKQCVEELRKQVTYSRLKLKESIHERRSEWESEVGRKNKAMQRHPHHFTNVQDTGVAITSGVPDSPETLRAMWAAICARRQEEESDEAAAEVSVVVRSRVRPVLTRQKRQTRIDSESGEYISLGDPSSEAEQSEFMSLYKQAQLCQPHNRHPVEKGFIVQSFHQ